MRDFANDHVELKLANERQHAMQRHNPNSDNTVWFWPLAALIGLAMIWLGSCSAFGNDWPAPSTIPMGTASPTPAVAAESSVGVWQRALAPTAWRDCYDAATRIRSGNSLGSGCVFHVDQRSVWVITNAHVVGSASTVQVEFFRRGYKSNPLAGQVTYRNITAPIDVAIVALPVQSFGGVLPRPIPLGRDLHQGDELISVGCPLGDWPALWNGRVVSTQGYTKFLPGSHNLGSRGDQMQGRSGSVICDAQGQYIAGLIAWHDGTHGVAQPISMLRRFATAAIEGQGGSLGQVPTQTPRPRTYGDNDAQCGPNGCPPWRQQPQPPPQQPYGGGQNPWPNLPPENPPSYGSPPADSAELSDIRARLANLERDRAEFAAEWTRLKTLANQVQQDLPEIKAWVRSTNDEQLKQAAAYAERLLATSEKRIDQIEGEVERAAGVKGWAQEQVAELRSELRTYLGDLASAKNALSLLQQYRDNRAENAPVDAIRLTLQQSLGELKSDLRDYAGQKKDEAKSSALESAESIALRVLPWPIASVLSVALWAWRRRREPDPPAAQPASAKAA